MFKSVFHLGCFVLALQLAGAASTPRPSVGVRTETFLGWENSLVLSGGDCRAMIVPGIGGRIAHYSLNGDNVIYQEPGSGGKTLATLPDGFQAGGYQCDLGPELRVVSDHKRLWLGPYAWQPAGVNGVALQSEPDSGVGVQMEKEIVLDPDTGELGLSQRMKNVSAAETSYCLWDRTLCKGGGFALLPLSKKSRFKDGWSIHSQAEGRYVSGSNKTTDPRLKAIDGVLIIEAKGPPLKVGTDSDAGWIAYTVGRLLFIKFFPGARKASYTDGGNTVEFYCDERLAELEPLSPEVKLPPGQTYSFPEKWGLSDLERTVLSAAEARALVKRLPRSPFQK